MHAATGAEGVEQHSLALWLRLRQGAQAHSKEEAVKSMQSYKAGLSQAQANHEDMLLKAQRAPGEGVQGAGLQRRCAAESAAPALSHCAGVRASAAAVEGEPAAPTGLQELTKDDYDSFLRDAGDKLVIVDFYTDWYAPPRLGVAGGRPPRTQSRPPRRCLAGRPRAAPAQVGRQPSVCVATGAGRAR